jgi:fatty acid desaturase
VRKYRLWPRRAQVGSSGYAVLYAVPNGQSRSLAVRRAQPQTSPQLHPRPEVQPRSDVRPRSVARSRARARAAARRRLVLIVLLVALALPALVALVTGSALAWWVVVAVLPVVCTYVAVLFRARRLMAEREINVAFFGARERSRADLEEMFSASQEDTGPHLRAAGAGRY